MLHEQSTELHGELARQIGAVVGQENLQVGAMNSGGGVMVCVVDLSLDGRFMGRQLWLTRDTGWLLGFYDFGRDEEDEGVVVTLNEGNSDDPAAVAREVAGILRRLDFTTLDR